MVKKQTKKKMLEVLLLLLLMCLSGCSSERVDIEESNANEASSTDIHTDSVELSTYLGAGKDAIQSFIDEEGLIYDEEDGDYYNDSLSMILFNNGSLHRVSFIEARYSLFGVTIGDKFDFNKTGEALKQAGFPFYSDDSYDESNYIFYAESADSECILIRTESDGSIAFLVYDAAGMNDMASEFDAASELFSQAEIYQRIDEHIQSSDSFHGAINENAKSFIQGHESVFESKAYDDSVPFIGSSFDYDEMLKNDCNYGVNLFEAWGTITDIREEYLDDGSVLTWGILSLYGQETKDYCVFYYTGSISENIGDVITFVALPLCAGSYTTSMKTNMRCIFIGATYIYQNTNDDYTSAETSEYLIPSTLNGEYYADLAKCTVSMYGEVKPSGSYGYASLSGYELNAEGELYWEGDNNYFLEWFDGGFSLHFYYNVEFDVISLEIVSDSEELLDSQQLYWRE